GAAPLAAPRRHRVDAPQPAGRGEGAHRGSLPDALRRRAGRRAAPPADRARVPARRGRGGTSPDAVERALRQDRAPRRLILLPRRRAEYAARMAEATDHLARGLEVVRKLWGARAGGQELPAQRL